MTRVDPARIEEAGLNALQTQRQLFYDGWLLRLSPGKARRARSVNPHFGSALPLEHKIRHCERVYASHGLPPLFRLTPFARPAALGDALRVGGYSPFDETLVQVAALDEPPAFERNEDVAIERADAIAWVDAVAALRGSPAVQREAHLERVAHLPLESRRLVAHVGDVLVAAGQVVFEDAFAGVFDVVTSSEWRRRGIARQLVGELLARAWERNAQFAYLQVDAGNAAALALYRGWRFATAYAYWYWAPGGCEERSSPAVPGSVR